MIFKKNCKTILQTVKVYDIIWYQAFTVSEYETAFQPMGCTLVMR